MFALVPSKISAWQVGWNKAGLTLENCRLIWIFAPMPQSSKVIFSLKANSIESFFQEVFQSANAGQSCSRSLAVAWKTWKTTWTSILPSPITATLFPLTLSSIAKYKLGRFTLSSASPVAALHTIQTRIFDGLHYPTVMDGTSQDGRRNI